MSVVGYYQASDQGGDTALAPVGERVCESIKKEFPLAVAFVVRSIYFSFLLEND